MPGCRHGIISVLRFAWKAELFSQTDKSRFAIGRIREVPITPQGVNRDAPSEDKARRRAAAAAVGACGVRDAAKECAEGKWAVPKMVPIPPAAGIGTI